MKKTILSLLLLLITASTSAQSKYDVNGDGNVTIADVTLLVNVLLGKEPMDVEVDPDMFVDLGLPSGTLWARMNVGATSPEDYGLYFAWGETTGYTSDTSDGRIFNLASYQWNNGTNNTSLTKYCTNITWGKVDNKKELEFSDDAAYVNWSKLWRMPSDEQLSELINSDYTTIQWTTLNGVYGRKITSKSNGKSIFLPAAGCRSDSFKGADSYGNYWSRTLSNGGSSAGCLTFTSSSYYGISVSSISRELGRSIRPVRNIISH